MHLALTRHTQASCLDTVEKGTTIVLVTTSKALVTSSDALVSNSKHCYY